MFRQRVFAGPDSVKSETLTAEDAEDAEEYMRKTRHEGEPIFRAYRLKGVVVEFCLALELPPRPAVSAVPIACTSQG